MYLIQKESTSRAQTHVCFTVDSGNPITVIREILRYLPHACTPVEFVPRSWVLKHCHHVQGVPGVLGPHRFSNETLTPQAQGKVPFKSKGFAASVHVLQLGAFGEAAIHPTELPLPNPRASSLLSSFWETFLSLFLLTALRVTLALCLSRSPHDPSDNSSCTKGRQAEDLGSAFRSARSQSRGRKQLCAGRRREGKRQIAGHTVRFISKPTHPSAF